MPTTITIGPSKDNTLYQDTTGGTSNGAGEFSFTGLTGSNSIRRGVIAFAIAGNIPAGATINSVTLGLHMSRTTSGPATTELRRLTASWGEGTSNAGANSGNGAPAATNDATWLHPFYNTTLWTKAGGDFVSTVSAAPPSMSLGTYTGSSTA